jgi:hypothetical protein
MRVGCERRERELIADFQLSIADLIRAAPRQLNRWTPRLCMTGNAQRPEELGAKVTEGLTVLAPHLQSWVNAHLVEPRRVRLATDVDGTSFKYLWLVTNHTGENDSNCRLVYDADAKLFGLECTLGSGVEWYMGNYGSFSETVQNM